MFGNRVTADVSTDANGNPYTRYTVAVGGIITELVEEETITNALFALNYDMITPSQGDEPPRIFPGFAEQLYDAEGNVRVRRPAPLWISHRNVQDVVNQSQQAVRGGE